MKKRYTVFANKRRRAIRASKDYAALRGMDFKKAKDILTKDGFYEHEYGDKDNNNGYAVYRKGDKEVELQYRWVAGKRKGDAHAGKVTNVYVDEDINSATKVRSRRAIRASVDDAEVDLTFIGEPSAIMDLKNAALSAGDTITRFNANTLIIHTWDYAVDEYMEYANDLGLSVDDVNYVNSAKKITCSNKKSIKCAKGDFTYDFSEDEFPYRVTAYYDNKYRDIADGASFDELDEAVSYAHEKLSEGPVRIEHYSVGAVDINPDEYWANFDGDFWCTRDLVDWRDEVYKSMGIGASTNIRSAKKITCSYDADDIVMYFNGKKVFTGSVYDLTDTIEELCEDPVTHEKFQEWCNYYGDPFDFDGTPRDTAAVFVALIENEMDYCDGDHDAFYESGQKGLDFEIFYADQEVGIPE